MLKLENEKRQLMAKLKQSKNREEILEREKENAIKEGVSTKERIKGNFITSSPIRIRVSVTVMLVTTLR